MRQAYEDLINTTNKPLRSDNQVSTDAVRIYDSLKRRGYNVTENPNIERTLSDGTVET